MLALGPLDLTRVYVICIFEHLVGGMATAALFTMMMDACRPYAAGTDYTAIVGATFTITGDSADTSDTVTVMKRSG